MAENNQTKLIITLSKEFNDELNVAAKTDMRTKTSLVRKVLSDYLKETKNVTNKPITQ